MDLRPLSPLSEASLQDRSVPQQVILAIRLLVTCLEEMCETVAEDTGVDRYDDSTSEGQLRWRRCRNRVCFVLAERLAPGLEDAVADVSDNALAIRVSDCCLSFYSARNGTDQPNLSGPSKTKGRVVTEMQLQLHGLGAPEAPKRLVIVYEADSEGLTRAAVGMLETPSSWHWQVSAYERPGLTLAHADGAVAVPPAYDEQPYIALPEVELREAEDNRPELPAYDEQPNAEIPDMEMIDAVEVEEEDAGPGGSN